MRKSNLVPEYTSPEYTINTNPIGTRLKLEMKKRGLTSTELARRSDVLTSFIYDVISGKSKNPSTIRLSRIAESLGVSLTYLVRGEEYSQNNPVQNSENKDFIYIPRITPDEYVNDDKKISSYTNENDTYQFSREWIRSHLNTNISNLRIFTINGDSMEPTLLHQDTVILDVSKKKPSPPSIFIIFDGIGLTAKRLEYFSENQSQRIRIISDNQLYSTYECSISEVSVIGRVVWFSREI